VNFRVDKPIIYLITEGEATDSNFAVSKVEILEIVRVAVEEKVSLIQLREKRLSVRLLFELTVAAVEITSGSSTRLLVNDRADIAVAAKADGVHLAANSLPVRVIRQTFPGDFIIGVSTHTPEEAANAVQDGADFAVFGPIFETPGKGKPQGLDILRAVCDDLRPFPLIGIGGIGSSNYGAVLSAGAAGFAAIRYLNDPEKLRKLST
jgi:thiamine-phosphate pyrophosphorylase